MNNFGLFLKAFSCFIVALSYFSTIDITNAKQFGLVVGINDYKHFKPRSETPPGGHTDLEGAVNDAKLVAKALRSKNVDLPLSHVLLDEQATTKKFLAAFDDILKRAKAGDTIILTFAGHGGQEREVAEPFDEKDNLDETLMFYEFDPKNPRTGRLSDDQIREKLIQAKEYNILLVMDSCHSGGLERSVNKSVIGLSRNGGKWSIPIDPLLDEIIPTSGDADKSLVHVTQILATETDKLLVTETRIDGEQHGALSYYFAQGISGDADADKNNYVSRRELSNYIETQVVAQMNQNQKPRLLPRGDDTTAFELVTKITTPTKNTDPKTKPKPKPKVDHRITVRSISGVENFALGSDAIYVDHSADLTFEPAENGWNFYNHTGDKIYHLKKADELSDEPQKIVARAKLLKALPKLVRPDLPLSKIEASQSAKLQVIGTRVKFRFVPPAPDLDHLTAFNIAGNGEFQFLYPQARDTSQLGRRGLPVEFKVVPPTGADQLVGIFCASQPYNLQNFLKKHHGSYPPSPSELKNHLRETDCQIGRIGLFTSAN